MVRLLHRLHGVDASVAEYWNVQVNCCLISHDIKHSDAIRSFTAAVLSTPQVTPHCSIQNTLHCRSWQRSNMRHIVWIKYKNKTYQFTTPCKSDEITHPKQQKSFFFWDNVIAQSHHTLTRYYESVVRTTVKVNGKWQNLTLSRR